VEVAVPHFSSQALSAILQQKGQTEFFRAVQRVFELGRDVDMHAFFSFGIGSFALPPSLLPSLPPSSLPLHLPPPPALPPSLSVPQASLPP